MKDTVGYAQLNSRIATDVKEAFEQIPIKWQKNPRVLDIGCGDGKVMMNILKKYMPENFSKLVGCDISQIAVDYAQDHYGGDKVQFRRLNIEDECPAKLESSFDHVFSFYAFKYVHKQMIAFKNIYDMLSEGGTCLIIFPGHSRASEVFEELSRTLKWGPYLKDVRTKFMAPYQDCPDIEGKVRYMMEQIGFKEVNVKVPLKSYAYPGGANEFKKIKKTMCPYEDLIPKWDDFMDDFVKIEPDAGNPIYNLIIAYGSK